MTTTEQLALPAWEADADHFGLTPGITPNLCDVDYPTARNGIAPEPETDLPNAMEMPTVLLPLSPLAGFDRLRHAVRKDFRDALDKLDDYIAALGRSATIEQPTAPEQPAVHETVPRKRRRWHRPSLHAALDSVAGPAKL